MYARSERCWRRRRNTYYKFGKGITWRVCVQYVCISAFRSKRVMLLLRGGMIYTRYLRKVTKDSEKNANICIDVMSSW